MQPALRCLIFIVCIQSSLVTAKFPESTDNSWMMKPLAWEVILTLAIITLQLKQESQQDGADQNINVASSEPVDIPASLPEDSSLQGTPPGTEGASPVINVEIDLSSYLAGLIHNLGETNAQSALTASFAENPMHSQTGFTDFGFLSLFLFADPVNPYQQIQPAVSFSVDTRNDLILGQIITHIQQLLDNDSDAHSYPDLSIFLENIQSFIASLQAHQIPDQYPLSNFESAMNSITGKSAFVQPFQDLVINFLSLVSLDYFMYTKITQDAARILAQYIRQFPDPEVEEAEAGAGWYQLALSQQGIDIQSSDNFDLLMKTYSGGMPENTLITKRNRLYFPIGEVEQRDATETVRNTNRRILLLCLPDISGDSLRQILEACAQRGILIIHISTQEETFHSLNENLLLSDDFIPVDDAPDMQIFAQVLETGFWHTIPDWYQQFRAQQGKPPLKKM